MKRYLIDVDSVLNCVEKSFKNQKVEMLSNDNMIWEQEKIKQKNLNDNQFPNIYINGGKYEGTMSVKDLYFSLCSTLNKETA